jgi:hypothetical protein
MMRQMDRHLREDSQTPVKYKRKEEDFLNAKNPQCMIKMSQFKNTFKCGG